MIKIENIYKSIEGHIIFEDFSLEVKDNEFVVITGASGCGKTTLLNMIGGIEPVDKGKIVVSNFCVTNQKKMKDYFLKTVGFLFQNFALVERKSIEKNLNMVRNNARSDISMEEALKKVGMAGKEKQKVYSLSGGEQQRVALARLMMKKCDVILADEPTGSLDRENAIHVIEILKSFVKNGKTVIMVTHDPLLIDETMTKIEL
ncbi:ATP-binding cassette domain-containing protein [Ruminococcus flavefaciens]|uniref:ATP-binding cassette domain-containing protein n=1 Tax=Ruminococcus flavefaciens TaxID=1265 RepID=UPI000465330F|nr:ATP-binding cassette domain-containing protein [Ruminococcus flavefaciens]